MRSAGTVQVRTSNPTIGRQAVAAVLNIFAQMSTILTGRCQGDHGIDGEQGDVLDGWPAGQVRPVATVDSALPAGPPAVGAVGPVRWAWRSGESIAPPGPCRHLDRRVSMGPVARGVDGSERCREQTAGAARSGPIGNQCHRRRSVRREPDGTGPRLPGSGLPSGRALVTSRQTGPSAAHRWRGGGRICQRRR